ncbi:MAG: hypothetical protein FJ316_04330 [SAR202 cluster bacterium]|nr:hypothetical protein [SAR202 cluster bacterium]
MQQTTQFGIYLNPAQNQVVRINSPYWIPPAPEWVLLTPEVNATLLQLRELARSQGLSANPDTIKWGSIPLREG